MIIFIVFFFAIIVISLAEAEPAVNIVNVDTRPLSATKMHETIEVLTSKENDFNEELKQVAKFAVDASFPSNIFKYSVISAKRVVVQEVITHYLNVEVTHGSGQCDVDIFVVVSDSHGKKNVQEHNVSPLQCGINSNVQSKEL